MFTESALSSQVENFIGFLFSRFRLFVTAEPLAIDILAEDFLAEDILAEDFLAEVFLAEVFLVENPPNFKIALAEVKPCSILIK